MPTFGVTAYQEVQKRKPQQYSVYNPEYQRGETISYEPLKQAIGTGPRPVTTPQPTTQQTFTLPGLQQAITKASQTGQAIPVSQARFQTPEQLTQAIQAITQSMQPLTQARTQAAQTGFNEALNRLASQWASRGLLSSGAAAAQERQAAENLAQTLGNIQAQAQAEAVPLALQYGQLGLQEAGQLFGQQAANREFEYQRALDAVRNMLAGLGQQEQMRQFEQTFGLDVEKLRSAEAQNYLNQLARQLQMEQEANQWAQEFGLSRQAQDFNRWLQTQQLNQGAESDWLRNLISGAELAQRGVQAEREQNLAEKQANLNAALAVSNLLGRAVAPTDVWGDLFTRAQTAPFSLTGRQAQAALTGYDPTTGQMTPEFRQAVASLTGIDPVTGQPTWQRRLAEQNLALDWYRATKPPQAAQLTPRQQFENQVYEKLMSGKQLTDEEAALLGLPSVPKGITETIDQIKNDFNELKKQGYSKEDVQAIAAGYASKLAKDGISPQLLNKITEDVFKESKPQSTNGSLLDRIFRTFRAPGMFGAGY